MISTKELIAILSFYRKYFFISLGLVFAMVFIQNFKILSVNQVSPYIKEDLLKNIRLKLQQKGLIGFHLKNSLLTQANAAGDYENAAAYVSLDFDSGEIFTQKELQKRLPIASLTKLMSAIITLDLASPEEIFTISDTAANQTPTKLGLVPSQKMTVEELLNGMLLVSANDAAKVLEMGINQKYGEQVFIKAMNEKAKILGLKNTHFENSQGLDNPLHFSSVEDLAILTKYALINYPLISDIVKKDYQFFPANVNHKQIDMYNWNGLLGVYPGIMGVKIGNTDMAEYTTIILSQRGDKKVLSIILGAPGVLQRDLWAAELLDLGFIHQGFTAVNITQDQLKAKYSSWKYWN